jgi:hypothetical protein
MQFHVFLTFTTTLFVAVLATPVAETNGEYRLGYKEECQTDGSLGLCMPGYYCKVQYIRKSPTYPKDKIHRD